ncbi:MAG: ribosomal-processing cysteine protease Prp [Ruminococcaceae bacterium]|nr:ribosomal-processing cysteine protease Prp [Oscillospiraceae bacterium]
MITIDVTRNKNCQIVRFTVEGHAGYSERGTDIVCASVTTAVMTAVNGLTDVAGIQLTPVIKDGYLDCKLPETLSQQERFSTDLLLESMMLTLQNIVLQYGDYVNLREM